MFAASALFISNESQISIDEPILEIDGLIDSVLDKTCILDILDTWGIEYSPCRTGEFSHRTKCPLTLHSFGDERTASFFIVDSDLVLIQGF